MARTHSMRNACAPDAPQKANPAVLLAALLTAAELEGLDRLAFFYTQSLKPVSRQIGYLVGASTCKKGRGNVPIFGRSSGALEVPQKSCLAVILKIAGEVDPELGKRQAQWHQVGVPLVTIELNGPDELAA